MRVLELAFKPAAETLNRPDSEALDLKALSSTAIADACPPIHGLAWQAYPPVLG